MLIHITDLLEAEVDKDIAKEKAVPRAPNDKIWPAPSKRYAIGEQVGKWTIVEAYPKQHWLCECVCGTREIVKRTGLNKAAGCSDCRAGYDLARKTKHGLSDFPGRCRWQSMISRCHDERDSSYANYGGRGIKVCDRWRFGTPLMSGFECFVADMGVPESQGVHLHRIDNDGHYEPGNCRWLTAREHARGHRGTRKDIEVARNSRRGLREVGRRMTRHDLTAEGKRLHEATEAARSPETLSPATPTAENINQAPEAEGGEE